MGGRGALDRSADDRRLHCGWRRVATEDSDGGHADRFWAAALACAAAETSPAVYELHRVNNHADLRGMPQLGRPGAVRWRGRVGAL